jgi:hypothetical protein
MFIGVSTSLKGQGLAHLQTRQLGGVHAFPIGFRDGPEKLAIQTAQAGC